MKTLHTLGCILALGCASTKSDTGAELDSGAEPVPSETCGSEASAVPIPTADGETLQTITLRLSDAADVDKIVFAINHAYHVENGRGYSGYFDYAPTGCFESSSTRGNERTSTCGQTV